MIFPRFRRLAVPLVVGVVGLGLSGCASHASDAATVTFHDAAGDHSVHISQSQFNDELRALSGNAQFTKALETTGLYPNLNGDISTDQQLASRWLSRLITQTAVDAEIASGKITLTAADTTQATQDQTQNFPGFSDFKKPFATTLVTRDAQLFAILRYYETCPSGRFVSHILLKTQAAADTALAQIHAGQSFAAIAKAKSTDTTSGAVGGALGCVTPSEFVAPFQTAAESAPFDTVVGPVQTKFGHHLILVRRWDPVGDKQYTQALSQAAINSVNARLAALKVWVNPRYGSWGEVTDTQGNKSLAVVPPTSPNPRVCREQQGCTPTTTTSTTVPAGG